jgi:hypothetical protein
MNSFYDSESTSMSNIYKQINDNQVVNSNKSR